jgi:hypothetical protein
MQLLKVCTLRFIESRLMKFLRICANDGLELF